MNEVNKTVQILQMKKPENIVITPNSITQRALEKNCEILSRFLKEYGFKYISRGASRRVYISKSKKIVVKIEHAENYEDDEKGWYQNREEVKNWLEALPKIKKFLLPILAYAEDYSWIIMPYARIPTEEEYSKMREKLLKEKIYLHDSGLRNSGVYRGKCYIVDYGIEEWK